jgi:ferric-dicitrate binding protein FerR (iron transport regulator)
MNEEQFRELLERYRLGLCTEEEKVLLESWYISQAGKGDPVLMPTEERMTASWQKVLDLSGLSRRRQTLRIRYWSAAAAVLLVLAGGGYWYSRQSAAVSPAIAAQQDLPPGSEKAILTLADGKVIALSDAQNGTLATQGNSTVTKTKDGQLVYQAGQKSAAGPQTGGLPATLAMNTVTTPRGGQYHLVLADGSKVWLNAASSISYPAAFTGSERRVSVTGEAYFEVSPDKSKPFKVQAGEELIDVLGTSFNVNVYADEPVHKVTLEAGSVKVNAGQLAFLLRPGEQTRQDAKSFGKTDKVDMDEALAWKNGDFVFNNEDLSSILRKLSRWYNVDISWQGSPGPMSFDGIISRSKNISAVLQIMESSTKKIHFQIEKRRLMVITNP